MATSRLTSDILKFTSDGSDINAQLFAANNVITFSSSEGTVQLKGVTNPTDAQDAATKNYVDGIAAAGISWKNTARLATEPADMTGSTYEGPFVDTNDAYTGTGVADGTQSVAVTSGGSGTGMTVEITFATNAITDLFILNYGTGYVAGDTGLTILGTSLGGATPADDVTFDLVVGSAPDTISWAAKTQIDGTTVLAGDRILVKNAAAIGDTSLNSIGIYEVTDLTGGIIVLTRTSDAAYGDTSVGSAVYVYAGDAVVPINGNKAYVFITSNGSTLYWGESNANAEVSIMSTVPATTPGGLDTQVQYNNNGALGGISGLTTNGTDITITDNTLLNIGNTDGTTISGNGTGTTTITPAVAGELNIDLSTGLATTEIKDFKITSYGSLFDITSDFDNGTTVRFDTNTSSTQGSVKFQNSSSDILVIDTGISAYTPIVLNGSTSGSASLQVAAIAGSGTVFQLPINNGTVDYLLKTDGFGITSWASPADSMLALIDQHIYVGNAGTPEDGGANFLYDNTSSAPVVTLGGSATGSSTLNMGTSTFGSTIASAGSGLFNLTSAGAFSMSSAVASNVSLFDTNTTGSITMGAALTSGTLTIGNSTAGTGTISIDGVSSIINIGPTTSGGVNIGSSAAGAITVNGSSTMTVAANSTSVDIGSVANSTTTTLTGQAVNVGSTTTTTTDIDGITVSVGSNVTTTLNLLATGVGGDIVATAGDVTNSGTVSISTTTATTATVAGGEIDLTAGNGNTTGAGGALDFNAGNGGSTGVGGAITLNAGAGGATSGLGGGVIIQAGSASAVANAGNVVLKIAMAGTSTTTNNLIEFQNNTGTQIGRVENSGDFYGTTFNATSDARYKTNIMQLNDPLSAINRIESYSYNWKEDFVGYTDTLQYGVLAQQLEEVGLHNLVAGSEESKAVNYLGLIPLLIGAVKELSAKVDRYERPTRNVRDRSGW